MSPNTRAHPPPQSERVRRLWLPFQQSVEKKRSVADHKVKALLARLDKDYERTPQEQRLSLDQHKAYKEKTARQSLASHFETVRSQWVKKLAEAGLRPEHWTDMSAEEMQSVSNVLGSFDDDNNDSPVQAPVPNPFSVQGPSRTYPTASAYPLLAPSLSSSTRSSNISTTSSYAMIDPSEFHSEDDDFLPGFNDFTSDDDDGPAQPAGRQNGVDAWSSDSSSHRSLEPSSSSRPTVPPTTARKLTSAAKQAASQTEREQVNGSKPKSTRQSYVGPIVGASDDAQSDDDDFERFKMTICIQKIVEFHQAAAQADIDLAIAIYKERKAQNNDQQEVSFKVTDHQKRMFQLQMEKEEERKKIVAAERSKRRSEPRRRPGRSGTVIAPIPSMPPNPSWVKGFEDQVAEELGSHLSLDKILSGSSDVQEENIDRLLQRLFPNGSPNDNDNANFVQPGNQNGQSIVNGRYHQPVPPSNGWSIPSTSTLAASSSSSTGPTTSKKLPNRRDQKKKRKAKPSLFGDDSGDEGEEQQDEQEKDDVPQQQHNVVLPAPHPINPNPFMDSDAGEFISNQLMMANPELASAFAQWGVGGGGTHSLESEVPTTTTTRPGPLPAWNDRLAVGQMDTASSSSPSGPWNTRHVLQTPTVDNPNPWGSIRSTPAANMTAPTIATATATSSRRKASISSSATTTISQPPSLHQNPFFAHERPEPVSLKMMAAYNAANVNEKKGLPIVPGVGNPAGLVANEDLPKGLGPLPPPPPTLNGSIIPSSVPSTSTPPTITPQPKVENAATAKRLGKKQRQAQKKVGGGVAIGIPSPTEDLNGEVAIPGPESSLVDPPVSSEMAQPINGLGRGRKESFSSWGDTASTPRPPSKIPAHLLQSVKSDSSAQLPPSQLGNLQRMPAGASSSSTIKASQWGPPKAPPPPSPWAIFAPPPEPGSSKLQDVMPLHSGGRNLYVPGGFDNNEVDVMNNNGLDNDSTMVPPQFSTLDKVSSGSAVRKQPSPPAAAAAVGLTLNDTGPTLMKGKGVQQVPQPPPAPSPTIVGSSGGKKGKNKKGKGKNNRTEMEEVPNDEPDSRGGVLPIDSRFLLEESEPIESVPSQPPPPMMMFGGEIGNNGSPFYMPSGPGSGPEQEQEKQHQLLFDGDPARMAAAMKALQEGSARVESELSMRGSGTGWGGANLGTRDHHHHHHHSPAAIGAAENPTAAATATAAAASSSSYFSWGQSKSTVSNANSDEGDNNVIPKTAFSPAIQSLKRNNKANSRW